MERRNFLFFSAVSAALTTLSGAAKAIDISSLPTRNIIFTQDNGGVWDAKKASHVPKVEVVGGKVVVSTDHGQKSSHYIVRHTLLLADGSVVGAKTFSYQDDPVSEYKLPDGYKGKIYATSFCNKHDLWLSEVSV
jgi:superoxide reductase